MLTAPQWDTIATGENEYVLMVESETPMHMAMHITKSSVNFSVVAIHVRDTALHLHGMEAKNVTM